MADPVKVYREVGIDVGMGEYPTNFTSAVIDTMTENDIVKLLVTFPPRYDSYRKIIDIGYTTASAVYTVEYYEMTFKDELQKYWFILDRRFTYGEKIYIQFRARFEDGQESVDPQILKLKFRPALRRDDFDSLETHVSPTQTEILQKLVDEHANVHASLRHTGHVSVDETTITINDDGVISAQPFVQLVRNPDEFITNIADTQGIVGQKTVLDKNGYIHGIFSFDTDTMTYAPFEGSLFYYTNRNNYNINKHRIFPNKFSYIEDPNFNFYWPYDDWIGRDLNGHPRGAIMQFDLSSIPDDVEIIKAEIGIDIKSLDYETRSVPYDASGYQWDTFYYPNTGRLQLLGESIRQLSTKKAAFVDSLNTIYTEPGSYSITIPSSSVAYVDEANPITAHLGDLWCEFWNNSSVLQRINGLIKPDLSTLQNISPDDIINADIALKLFWDMRTSGEQIGVYRITSDWDPTTVTWNTKPSIDPTPTYVFDELVSTLVINGWSYVENFPQNAAPPIGWSVSGAICYNYDSDGCQIFPTELTTPTGPFTTDPCGNFISYMLPQPISAGQDFDLSVIMTIGGSGNASQLARVVAGLANSNNVLTHYGGLHYETFNSYPAYICSTPQENNISAYDKTVQSVGLQISRRSGRVVISVNYTTSVSIDNDNSAFDRLLIANQSYYCDIIVKATNVNITVFDEFLYPSVNIDIKNDVKRMISGEIQNYGWYLKYVNETLPPNSGDGRANDFNVDNMKLNVTTSGIVNTAVSVWNNNGDLDIGNCLFQFDFSSLPPEYVVMSATLVLESSESFNNTDREISIHHINSFWEPETLSWEDRPNYDSTPLYTFNELATGSSINIDVTDEIYGMTTGSIVNNGWYMKYATEFLPAGVGDGYQINFIDPILKLSLLIPNNWETGTVVWSDVGDSMFQTILGTFAATGPWNRVTIDMTSIVKIWKSHPECNNGIFLSSVPKALEDEKGFYIYGHAYAGEDDIPYTDRTGFIPRLTVQYDNGETTNSGDNVWNIFPVFDYINQDPADNYYAFDWMLPGIVYPDIAVDSNGVVHVITPVDRYAGVKPNYPFETGTGIIGYADIKITDEERIIDIVKSTSDMYFFFGVGYNATPNDRGCYDPKITVDSDNNFYVFIKKISDEDPTREVIEVYSNIGTAINKVVDAGEVKVDLQDNLTVSNKYGVINQFVEPMYLWQYDNSEPLDTGTYSWVYCRLPTSSIPLPPESGQYISSATLSFKQSQYISNVSRLKIYRITSDWDVNTINWNNRPTYDPTPIADLELDYSSDPYYYIVHGEILNEIIGITTGSITNYGWIMKYDYADKEYGYEYLDLYPGYLDIKYAEDIETETSWDLEYRSSPIIPESYDYMTSNTKRYMGGEAVSYGNNVYFAYISHYQTTNINPNTGTSDSCLIFQVKMLSKINGSWSESVVYEFAPMFSITQDIYPNYLMYSSYWGILNNRSTGYPFGLIGAGYSTEDNIPEQYLLNISVRNDSDISIIFPTFSRYENCGVPDMLWARYNGTSWIVKDLRMNDWDKGSRNGQLSVIMPASILYNTADDIKIAYTLYSLPFSLYYSGGYFFGVNKYAKYNGKKWIFMDKIGLSAAYQELPFGFDKFNLIKLNSGQIAAIITDNPTGLFSEIDIDYGTNIIKRTLYG